MSFVTNGQALDANGNTQGLDFAQAGKTVLVKYAFQSKGNSALYIARSIARNSKINKITLEEGQTTTTLSVGEKVQLIGDHDYALVLDVTPSGDRAEISLESWLGQTMETPRRMLACKDVDDAQTTIAPFDYPISIFINGQPYVSENTYCGVAYNGKKTNGSGQMSTGENDDFTYFAEQALIGKNTVQVEINRDVDHGNAFVQCKVNGTVTKQHLFSPCVTTIDDAKKLGAL